MVVGCQEPTDAPTIQSHTPKAQETWWRTGQKDCKKEPEDQEVCCKMVS